MIFRILVGIGALVLAVLGFFFVQGLADGSVSGFDNRLWAATLAAPALVLGAALVLARRGRRRAASILLLILAVPAVLLAAVMGFLAIAEVHWD